MQQRCLGVVVFERDGFCGGSEDAGVLGHVVEGIQVVCRVDNTIAIALVGRCGSHGRGGWGRVVRGKLGRGGLSWY